MTIKESICIECKGYGKLQGLYRTTNHIELTCPICNGTGELPENIEYDPERGKALREERMVKEIGASLRDFCKEHGLDAQERSKMERGFFAK